MIAHQSSQQPSIASILVDERIAALEAQLTAERERRERAEAELDQSQKLQQRILNALPDSCWFKDTTGRYRVVNDAFCRFHQLLPGMALGHSAEELFDPDLAARMLAGDQAAIACGTLYRSESHVLTAHNTEYWVETMKQPIYSDAGELLGIVGLNHDITAQRSAELDRLHLERRLHTAQRQESIGLLASGIAHDFNNLLTSILGNAQLAQLELAESSPGQESLKQIVASSQYAARLASQLLSYAGKGHFHIQATNLNTLVHDMAEMIHVSLPRSVKVEFQLAEQLPMIAGDATQLQQVILNLLTNAAEAISTVGGSITLHTAIDLLDRSWLDALDRHLDLPAGQYVRLEVQDTGEGMDEATLGRIFEPFFSTKRTGRGLGLAAVQGIIRRHKGILRVSSSIGSGTLFQIWLPISEVVVDPRRDKALPTVYKGTILVIDDEETVRNVACRMLQHLGFQTCSAVDGESGLAMLTAGIADLVAVLIDLTMPGMGGEATARLMNASQPQLPIMLMSGYYAKQSVQEHSDLHLAAFIPKPLNFEALRNTLDTLLKSQH